ncbi:glycosyltransferase family 2 protein [Brucella anthropi]|uniref:glycosyltransferase family 2 protein n=1 Tax=Brucella anthropi TaxID=529 RepID=UPI00124E3494|nr:glycosyltransferase family 2 protein [Brucella anthropi]KAB2724125.1 glycosyltransferase family 2 protein [Brucella anthropi]KAB2739658.1 glycosyltransferase family 2 protein [Brucella anthropi]KAB2802017.1 glycosyltransferase family 2 protein [Brucella anthropi]
MIPSLQQQSVLYNTEKSALERALDSIENSSRIALRDGIISKMSVRLGDCSPNPCLSQHDLDGLSKKYLSISIEYVFFGENLGSARGHNRLASDTQADYLLIQNPDVVPSPRLYQNLFQTFQQPKVGMVEAKQLPIEHPKEYDANTGETSWASTACALVKASTFVAVGGFDEETFFLYCDDVDFSWRVREYGLRVIFQPAATVFHDKRLSSTGGWQPSDSEIYYSAEAAMLLMHKWSRPDLAESTLNSFKASELKAHREAAAEFEQRRHAGALPEPRDQQNKIAQFVDGNYAAHRYAL